MSATGGMLGHPDAASSSDGSGMARRSAEPGGAVHEIDQGQLLASIAATSSDCILSLDHAGTIVWASPATRHVLGWWPEDLAGSDISVVTPRSGGDVNAAYLARLLEGDRVDPFTDTGVRRDGSTFKAAVTLGPVHAATGEVTGVTVILRDVTAELSEHRAMEQALELARARFERMPTPQALLGLGGQLESVNPAWCELFAHDEDYFVECDIMSLVHPMDVRNAAELFASLRSGELESVSYQGLFRDSDEGSLSLLIDATLLRDPEAVPYSIAVSARDLALVEEARRALAVQESLYVALGRRSWDAAIVLDSDLAIGYVTPSVARMLGYDEDEVLSKVGWEYLHPADAELAAQTVERVLAEPRLTERLVVRLRDKQDRWRWIESAVSNCLADPDIRGLVVNVRDITEQVQTDEALRLSEALHRAMVETAQQGITAIAPDGTTLFVNETMTRMLGIAQDESADLDLLTVLAPENGSDTPPVAADGPARYEITYPHPAAGERVLEVSRSPLNRDGAHPLGFLIMVSDVTEARHAERALRRQALHDPLTGLPNRYLFLDRLQTAAARHARSAGSGTAVLYLDLDGFKPVNDGHGHEAGDDLLREIAARLVSAVRVTDTVGRLGGDEFAVVCEDTDEEAALLVATRIHEAFGEQVQAAGSAFTVRLSIGIALSPPHAIDELVGCADRAMYRAKQLGGGRVVVAEADDQGRGRGESPGDGIS
jgi:diguanylate cyclase (GGDEF)-like protein/PAS domain S-box-containing protein